jgi:hypothetical protein
MNKKQEHPFPDALVFHNSNVPITQLSLFSLLRSNQLVLQLSEPLVFSQRLRFLHEA